MYPLHSLLTLVKVPVLYCLKAKAHPP
ncbi:hypothetical protein ID866_11979 [Astraeus odoratus]|nr:hypothetical protein ID866_11979 [Astraeus odoratus]